MEGGSLILNIDPSTSKGKGPSTANASNNKAKYKRGKQKIIEKRQQRDITKVIQKEKT